MQFLRNFIKGFVSSATVGTAQRVAISYCLVILAMVASGCRTMYPDAAYGTYPCGLRSAEELALLKRAYWAGFNTPAAMESRTGLYAVTPYYPGKVPVVLVHGLLSEPRTWDEMLSKLRRSRTSTPTFSSGYSCTRLAIRTCNPPRTCEKT